MALKGISGGGESCIKRQISKFDVDKSSVIATDVDCRVHIPSLSHQVQCHSRQNRAFQISVSAQFSQTFSQWLQSSSVLVTETHTAA